MKVEALGSFTAPIYVIVIILTLCFSFEVKAQASARGNSPAQLHQRILELYQHGKFKDAIPLAEKLVALTKRARGDDRDTAISLNDLALLYQAMGNYAKAEPLFKEALVIQQTALGPEHPTTATILNNLALLYQAMGNHAKAEPLLEEALAIRQKVLGREHPDTAASLNNLALLYYATGKYAQAEPLYQQTLEISKKVLGPEHPTTATMYFPRKNGHVILGFCLLYHRRNRVTLSPEPPGILRFGLAPAGSGPGPVGRAEAATPAVCKAAAALKVRPEQSSILRCNIETLGSVAFTVNYLPKLCFIVTRRLVSQCAVEPLVIVVKLDVFEDLTPGLGPAAEDLLLRKTFCFQRTEECLHHRIIKAICCPTHALSGPNNTQRFAHCLAAVLAASIGVKVQALFRLAQNQGIPQRRNNQFRLQCLT